MNANVNNLSSQVHQEIHEIFKDEIASIVNHVDARVQNFKNHFLKEETKFVRDFKSLAKEANESLDKITVLEKENKHLLRAVVSQDIMLIVQNKSVVDTSNLQTELDRTKEKLETCIIKKEKEYTVLWNNWYKKCEECKYDKISYDKAYNGMQNQIKRLQAQLGDLKGKSMNTPCESNTLDPLSQKLDDEKMSLELHTKFSEQQNAVDGTGANTKFAKPSILGKLPLQPFRNQSVVRQPTVFKSERPKFQKTQFIPKVVEKIDLTKPVTSHSIPKSQESNIVKYNKVIASRMFRISPLNNSMVDTFVPNKHVKASIRTKPITVSQPHVITNKDVNSNTQKHTSSACNNIKLAIWNDKFKVICATCKQCFVTANHDECVFKYVNGMNSSKKNQSANVSESENQKKQ
ncbi:hypothetical protein Tco_0517502 [Tanacetum coccineum]